MDNKSLGFIARLSDKIFRGRIENTKDITEPIVDAVRSLDNGTLEEVRASTDRTNEILEEINSKEPPEQKEFPAFPAIPEFPKEMEVSIKGISTITLKGDKGDDGYSPVKGKDYFTKEEISSIVSKIQKSIVIPKPGKDGVTPIAGVDYPDEPAIRKMVEECVAMVPTPMDGVDGMMPKHEWDKEKTKVRFEIKPGKWGKWSAILKGEDYKKPIFDGIFNGDKKIGGRGISTFLELTDSPNTYAGQANKVVSVKATEDGVEFTTPSSGAVEGTAILSTGEVGGTKFLRENGDGTSSWQTPPGSGNVSKVGTPVNNQVGVWTGDGTLEGDAALTYDATTDTLTSVTFAGALTGTASGNLTSANIEDSIVDGHTTIAPSGNAVFDALALKSPLASPTFTGTVTLPVGLTGVIRADTGVLSVDSDVTDIVAAGTTSAAGKLELATDAEMTTGTDTARAITPANAKVELDKKVALAGGTMTGLLEARDHGTATTDEVVNVSYGTSATPPTANTTTEGSLYVQYVA